MQFSDDILMRGTIFVLGICGFWVARHIYEHKKAKKPLVCPVGFDCNFVVHSDFSEFMHIPLEIFGMIYYAGLSIVYGYFIFVPAAMPAFFEGLLLLSALGAFVFSLYLLIIQIFVLKKGCSWCIVSALISTFVFIITAYGYDFSSFGQFLTT